MNMCLADCLSGMHRFRAFRRGRFRGFSFAEPDHDAATLSRQKMPRKCRRFAVPLPESTGKRLHGVSFRRGTFMKHRNRKAKSVAGPKQAGTLDPPEGVVLQGVSWPLFGCIEKF